MKKIINPALILLAAASLAACSDNNNQNAEPTMNENQRTQQPANNMGGTNQTGNANSMAPAGQQQ